MRTLRVYPPLRAWIRFSFTIFAVQILVLIVVDIARALLAKRQIELSVLDNPARVLTAIAAIAFSLAIFLFAVYWTTTVVLCPTGMRSFFFRGRAVEIAWADVGYVERDSERGIPFIVVTSAAADHQIRMCTFGLDTHRIHDYLRIHAGDDHVLTQWFTPNRA